MAVCFSNILYQFAFADVLGVVAVSEKNDVEFSIALCGFLKGDEFIFSLFVVVLCDLAPCAVVLPLEHEDHFSFAWL